MTTIRRIYAYLLAFAGLAMLAIAAANLGQLLLDLLLRAPLAATERYVRDTASLYGAMALVGLPAWLLHWLWTERTARSDDAERKSTLRRLYLYAALAGATLVLTISAADVLRNAFDALLGDVPPPTADTILRSLPLFAVALAVWLPHWRISARDRDRVGETGGSATLRRWYTYGAAFVGLLVMLAGVQGLVEALWRGLVLSGTTPFVSVDIAGPATAALVGLGLWLVHWVVLPRRLPDASRLEDGTAVLRSVYLFLALAVAVIGTLSGLSQLLYYAVARLLGVDEPGGVGGVLLVAAAGPASTALVYGSAWAYQRLALRHQATMFAEAPRQTGIRRLYVHVVALVALAVLATGIAGLLWTLGDVAFATASVLAGNAWRERVALFATLAVVGLPVWLLHWRAHPSSDDDARALSRRLYLYLSLIAAALTLIGSAALGLYKLLGVALGGSFGTDVATDLAHALAVGAVAAAVAGYHWRVLRSDALQSRPDIVPTAAPDPVLVEIRAVDGASLTRALSALRATGVQVTVHEPRGAAIASHS